MFDFTIATATVTFHQIGIIAFFPAVNHTVAALGLGQIAHRVATVTIYLVAIVALLALGRDAVATGGKQAIRIAAVAVDHVSIVAFFPIARETIATIGLSTIGIATVTADEIAVVAFLRPLPAPVATHTQHAIAAAFIVVGCIAVIALFPRGNDAVATPGRQAIRIAAIAVDGIAVVAQFIRTDDAVAAPFRSRIDRKIDARGNERGQAQPNQDQAEVRNSKHLPHTPSVHVFLVTVNRAVRRNQPFTPISGGEIVESAEHPRHDADEWAHGCVHEKRAFRMGCCGGFVTNQGLPKSCVQ